LSDEDLNTARDSKQDIKKRWEVIEPYWHAAKSTGYGRTLALAARDLYDIETIGAGTIELLNERFQAARSRGGHYDFVLKRKSGIALSIRDEVPVPYRETDDPLVFALHVDELICPSDYGRMRKLGREVDIDVNTLEDWAKVVRRHIERHLNGQSNVVCLKCALAYDRSLRFEKVGPVDAERDFAEVCQDRNLPEERQPIKAGRALGDYMMHRVCAVANDLNLPFQIHTGIQEGNGNIISNSDPTLLSNLFLEFGNARFDLFHMGYPYVMETGTLAKMFRNVFIDMCWGHIISPEAARRGLAEWLDAVPANKISAFGGDYGFVDGVYGHQLLARQNVAAALAQKVSDGSMSLSRAREVADWMFVDNPKNLFSLDRFLK
jgi:hypothetical protein